MKRIPELDALRGLAAVGIVAYHLWFPTFTLLGTGVDLFFVMSGYLITTIILEHRGESGFLAAFYARRSLRIWPIYYLSLLVLVAINPYLPKPSPTDGLPYYLTYTQNLPHYWGAENPSFIPGFTHTWSLAVEEQYYLVWPLALVLLGRRSPVPLAMALIGVAVGTRMVGYSKWIAMTHLDGLALGGVLAAVLGQDGPFRMGSKWIDRLLVGVWAVSVAFIAAKGHPWLATLGGSWPGFRESATALSLRLLAINLAYFGVVGLVVIHSGHRWLAPLRDRRLALLGQMSYGIYLYHYFLFDIVRDYAERLGLTNRPAIDAVKLAVSFAVAYGSWRLIERPLLSLKGRFAYEARPSTSTSLSPSSRPGPELAALESLRPGVR